MRRILRRLGFSPKRSVTEYSSAAAYLYRTHDGAGAAPKRSVTEYSSAADTYTVWQWQTDAAYTIRGAKRRGFAVVV